MNVTIAGHLRLDILGLGEHFFVGDSASLWRRRFGHYRFEDAYMPVFDWRLFAFRLSFRCGRASWLSSASGVYLHSAMKVDIVPNLIVAA